MGLIKSPIGHQTELSNDRLVKEGVVNTLNEANAHATAFFTHAVGPQTGLNFANVGFVKEEHAQTRLPDTSADAERKFPVEQLCVKEEFLASLQT